MRIVFALVAISFAVISAKPEGYFRQNYQFKKSSATYKNNELQTKDDDEGFYTKQGDLEGRSTPKVDQGNEHREFVNPSVDGFGHTITKYNDRDLTDEAESAFSRHNLNSFGGAGSSSFTSGSAFTSTAGQGSGYGAAGSGYGATENIGIKGHGRSGYRTGSGYSSNSGYSSGGYGTTAHDTSNMDSTSSRQGYSYGRNYESSSQSGRTNYSPSYGVSSNLAVVTQNVQHDLSKQVEEALSTLRQNTYSARRIDSEEIRHLEDELRSNLTRHLQDALNRQYGTQEKKGTYSYTVSSGGGYSPRANYDNQELIDLKAKVEQELLKQLREGVRYTESSYQYSSSHSSSSNYGRGTSTVHRDSAEVEDLNRHRPSYSQVVQNHTPERITEPNTRVYQTYSAPSRYPTSSSQYRPVYTESTPLDRVVVNPTLSVSVVAQNVQNDLSKKIIESIRDYEDRYNGQTYHLTNSRPDYQTQLDEFKYQLKNNITSKLYEELEKTYGRQYQRGGYWFTTGSTSIANYKQEDLETLKKQMEDNLIKYLETNFRDQEDRYISSQSHTSSVSNSYQSGRKYKQYSPAYTKSLTAEGVNTGYVYNPNPSYVPSSQITTGQNTYGSTYNTETSQSSQVELQQIKSEIERDLARQMQVAIHEQQPITATYTNQAAIQDLTEEIKRNLTAKLQETLQKRYGQQGMRNGYSYTVSASGVYNPKANYNSQDMQKLMQQMQDDLVRQLNEQMSRRDSQYSSSQYTSGYQPSHSAYGSSYGGATKGSSYAKSSSYSYSSSHGTTGEDCLSCMQNDQAHNVRSKRSYYGGHDHRQIDMGHQMMHSLTFGNHGNPAHISHANFEVGQEEEDFGQQMEEIEPTHFIMPGMYQKVYLQPHTPLHVSETEQENRNKFGQRMETFQSSHQMHGHSQRKPVDFEVGQVQEDVGQQMEDYVPSRQLNGNLHVHPSYHSHPDSEVGQEVEDFGQQIEDFKPNRLTSGSLHTQSQYSSHKNVEVGQEMEDFGQQMEEFNPKHPLSGNLHVQPSYQSHPESEVGQEVEDFGQQMEEFKPIRQTFVDSHRQSPYASNKNTEVGQEMEHFGQQMEEFNPKHPLSGSLHVHSSYQSHPESEVGQEVEDFGQQIVDFKPNHLATGNLHTQSQYSSHKNVEVGQEMEDFGQQLVDHKISEKLEKPLTHGTQRDSTVGQVEEHFGQQMEDFHANLNHQPHYNQQMEMGQEEEDFGQQIEMGQQMDSSEDAHIFKTQVVNEFGPLEFGSHHIQKIDVNEQKQNDFAKPQYGGHYNSFNTYRRTTQKPQLTTKSSVLDEIEFQKRLEEYEREMEKRRRTSQSTVTQNIEQEELGQQEDLDDFNYNQFPQNSGKLEKAHKQEGFNKLETSSVTKPQTLRGDQTEKIELEVTSQRPHAPSHYSQHSIYSQQKPSTEPTFKPFKPQYTHWNSDHMGSIGQEPEDELTGQQQMEEEPFQLHHYNMQSQYVNKPKVTNTFNEQETEDLNQQQMEIDLNQQQIEDHDFSKFILSSQNSQSHYNNMAQVPVGNVPDSRPHSPSYNYGTVKQIDDKVEKVEDIKPIETYTAKVEIVPEEITTTEKPGFWGKVGGSITNTLNSAKKKAHGLVEKLNLG